MFVQIGIKVADYTILSSMEVWMAFEAQSSRSYGGIALTWARFFSAIGSRLAAVRNGPQSLTSSISSY